jgi:hypothetical protein
MLESLKDIVEKLLSSQSEKPKYRLHINPGTDATPALLCIAFNISSGTYPNVLASALQTAGISVERKIALAQLLIVVSSQANFDVKLDENFENALHTNYHTILKTFEETLEADLNTILGTHAGTTQSISPRFTP